MYRRAVVLLLYQITRSLRLPVLIICCVACTVSIALSQEQSAPSDPEAVKPDSVVVYIPTDDEFYFGKVSIAEADIPEKVKQALKDKPRDEQIAYVLGLIRRRRWLTSAQGLL